MQWRREQVTNLVRKLYVEKPLRLNPALNTAANIAWGDGPQNDAGWYQTQPFSHGDIRVVGIAGQRRHDS